MKDDGRRIGCLDLVDHDEIALPGADDAVRRKDDLVPARGDILRCQWRAVGEFNPFADLEGVGLTVIGWLWYRHAEIADEIVGLARVVGVGADQDAVERRGRVDRRVGLLTMRVKARRRVRRYHIGQAAAALWLLVSHRRCRQRCRDNSTQCQCFEIHNTSQIYLSSQILAKSWLMKCVGASLKSLT